MSFFANFQNSKRFFPKPIDKLAILFYNIQVAIETEKTFGGIAQWLEQPVHTR